MAIPVYSKLYLETENEEWSAVPTSSLLHRIHHSEQSTVRWIAVLHYKGNDFHIALGDPVRDNTQAIFVPGWFLHQMGVIGDGEEMEVSFVPAETFPKAMRLKFSLIGDRTDEMEIRDLLEAPLSQLGILSKGQTIPIPVLEHHTLLVKECEPANTVFLDGAEIAFEIESEQQTISRQDTPWASPFTTANQNLFDGPMISPISNTVMTRQFIPFQGQGRTLSEM
jgi:hypothetical protein